LNINLIANDANTVRYINVSSTLFYPKYINPIIHMKLCYCRRTARRACQ